MAELETKLETPPANVIADLNLYQRIWYMMNEVDYIQKGDKRVDNKYTFVSHDQVTALVHPLFVKYRLVAIPEIQEYVQNGNRTEVCLRVKVINIDKPSEFHEIPRLGFGVDNQDKGPGKAVSYAWKYAMLKLLQLETGDDPDKDNIDFDPAGNTNGRAPIEAPRSTEAAPKAPIRTPRARPNGAAAPTDENGWQKPGCISFKQGKLLFMRLKNMQVSEEVFDDWLANTMGFESRRDIPKGTFNQILESVDTGAVAQWAAGRQGNEDDLPF